MSATARAVVALSACALAGGMLAAAPAASAATGVDMNKACNQQYMTLFGARAIVGNTQDVYSWSCYSVSNWGNTASRLGGIDVNKYCKRNVSSGSSAYFLDRKNAYTWRCT